jgi:hypothetical protein
MFKTIIISTIIFTTLIVSGCSFGVNEPSHLNADNNDHLFYTGNVDDPIDSCYIRIRQVSTQRYLDAYTTGEYDYLAVTRSFQDNKTQKWLLKAVANSDNQYTILHACTHYSTNRRYLDAYTNDEHDYSAVTRTVQENNTQKWKVTRVANSANHYRIQQVSTNRYLDAHESDAYNYSVVTRDYQNNDSQIWEIVFSVPPPEAIH